MAYINKLELLASGSYDCSIKLYNPLSYLLKDTIKTESVVNCLNYLGFSYYSNLLASGQEDNMIKI